MGEKSENEAGEVIGRYLQHCSTQIKVVKREHLSLTHVSVTYPSVSVFMRNAEIGYNMHDEDMTIRYKD